MIGAVVPVKTLSSAKSRLLPWLGRAALERLSIAMLSDVLETLQRVRALDRIATAMRSRHPIPDWRKWRGKPAPRCCALP